MPINDTPAESSPSYSCDDNRDTCPGGGKDPVHNYMDYSPDACKNQFTPQQASWMFVQTSNTSYGKPSLFSNILVTLNQKRESGQQLTGSQLGVWQGIPNFVNYTIPVTKPFGFKADSPVILQGNQSLVTSPNEKYNNWSRNSATQPDVSNFHTFIVTSNDNNFTSTFKQTYPDINIKNEFIDAPGLNPSTDNIGFRDPWFIDYLEANYFGALRNRGMKTTGNDALASRDRLAPFNPNFSDTYENGQKYNGVFLNQSGPGVNWQGTYYSVKAPQTINFGGSIGTRNVYLQNWTASPSNGAAFQSPNSYETAIVFNVSPVTVSANLKGSLLSGTSTAFANNGQRKYVKTLDGWSHMVYESNGHIYYEIKSPTGVWQIVSLGNKLYLDDTGGKSPSIGNCQIPSLGNSVIITFQEGSNIQVKSFFNNGTSYVNGPLTTINTTEPSANNMNPNITCSSNGAFMIVYERKTAPTGLNYRTGTMWDNNKANGVIPGTDNNSISAAISCLTESSQIDVDIAWEQYVSANTGSIKYCGLTMQSDGSTPTPYMQSTIPSGVSNNIKPTIISLPDGPRIGWIAIGVPNSYIKMYNPWLSQSWSYTQIYKRSPSINKLDNNSAFYLAWSWGETSPGLLRFVSSSNLSTIKDLNILGGDIQLCNGATANDMFVSSFSPYSVPYYFQLTNSIGSIPKVNANSINSGRGFIITRKNANTENEAELFYILGDISLNGTNIGFVKAEEKANYNKFEKINKVLLTEPFELDEKSELLFTESYGVSDSVEAIKLLDKKPVAVKIELVDAVNEKTIGEVKETEFASSDVQSFNIYAYSLNVSVPENKTVRLKISMETKFDNLKMALLQQYSEENSLDKINTIRLSLNGSGIIKEYSLLQNYPNPFNPSTTISYRLPKDGFVTLKVFDTIGNEVATLVNEYKTSGKYDVSFKAPDLASGVYLYQIKVNDYSATKKLILMK